MIQKIAIRILCCIMICPAYNLFASKQEKARDIGFACGYIGTPTGAISTARLCLQMKQYSYIRKSLFSEHPAFQFVAVIVLEKLENMGEIHLMEEEHERIKHIRESDEYITICSGCIGWNNVSIRDMFSPPKMVRKKTKTIGAAPDFIIDGQKFYTISFPDPSSIIKEIEHMVIEMFHHSRNKPFKRNLPQHFPLYKGTQIHKAQIFRQARHESEPFTHFTADWFFALCTIPTYHHRYRGRLRNFRGS